MNLNRDRAERHYESYHHNCVVTKLDLLAFYRRACATLSHPHVVDDNVVIANHAIIIISFIVEACREEVSKGYSPILYSPDFFLSKAAV